MVHNSNSLSKKTEASRTRATVGNKYKHLGVIWQCIGRLNGLKCMQEEQFKNVSLLYKLKVAQGEAFD